jgi:hypothetical protein
MTTQCNIVIYVKLETTNRRNILHIFAFFIQKMNNVEVN